METKRKALGKGLEQLFTNERIDFDNFEKGLVEEAKPNEIVEIKISEIRPNPYQPRKIFDEEALNELASSIKEHGIVQPIIVKKSIKGYELVAGERRTKAAKIAGLETVPAIVKDFDDEQMMEIALIENIQRENLNPIEEAMAYDSILKSSNITQDELAKKFGKSRSYITNSLGLLRLPDDTKKYVEDNKLSMSHARALSKLDDTEQINRLANKIVNENLNVRAIENITRDIHEQEIKKETDENTLFEFKQYDTLNTNHIYEDAMREKFGIKVKITGKKIEIPYSSQLELQRILELMDVKIEG
ncbi:parB-like partition protein [Mycoplasma sp. CAG:956]|nr:parB-like partition protein [Mycoplasma sp. CAG:956]